MSSDRYSIEIALVVPGEVEVAALTAMIATALEDEAIEPGAALSVLLTDDDALRTLNREHRDTDEATDVLSFPSDEGEPFPESSEAGGDGRYLGDIAVSLETVGRQADALGLGFELELRHVILHGTLHLLGLDHLTAAEEAAMHAREEAVLGAAIHAANRAHDD